jgi:preprotein translocase subunit SecE
VNEYTSFIIWALVIGGAFGLAWHQGYLKRIANYVAETREELRKCTWPSVDELKGSTVVVMVSIALLGVFTVGVDAVIAQLVAWIM